jgi:PAS domain S-box-containing protein
MNSVINKTDSIYFLRNGGEMGMLMRAKDWSKTFLGEPDTWPQSLRTTLGIILNSKFPMFLFWGPQLACFYNDAYRPSLGNQGKHPYILGMPGEDAWPEIWHIIKPLIDQVLAGGEATWSEDQLIPIYRNAKIEDVYWTFSYSPVRDETGNIKGVFVTCTETTSKVLMLKRIEESEKNFRNLINESPLPAALYRGIDFVIELANVEILKLWGKDESVIGKTLIEAIPELKDQPFIELMQQVYLTGKTFEGKEMPAWLEKNGKVELYYFNLIYKALYDSNGNIYGVLAVGYDVTDIKKHDDQKDDFIKMASHELKTPVTTIKGYTQLLLNAYKNGKDEMLTNSLITIDKQIAKLTKLITDLLDVTKIETGRFILNKENFVVNDLIEDILEDMRTNSPGHKIVFNQSLPISAYADKDRISQVLLNLLTNAIKYSPNADTIIVETQTTPGQLIISVKDFGIGIADIERDKIFERFYRVEGRNEKTFPGFGIGLFIVREIISYHNGKVWVESEKNKGSTFYFSLPV